MSLKNDFELANTRRKLLEFEQRYDMRSCESHNNPQAHRLILESLQKLIKQLKEEISTYEVHQVAGKTP